MKKMLSLMLVLCMVFSALPVLAQEVNLSQEVLMSIKDKIDVPDELSEFEYSQSTYDNVIRYDFTWHNEDYTKEMYASSDALGRLVSYNYYEQIDYSENRSLIGYTLADAKPMAEEFVKKAFGKYFENETDVLRLDDENITSSYSGIYKTFTFVFKRYFNGENVESNSVTVRIRATKENIYVQSVSASLDEDALFSDTLCVQVDENGYTNRFPVSFYYASDYSGEDEKVTLFYSIDKGFVSRIDGEVLTQEYFDRYQYSGYGVNDMAAETMSTTGASKNNALTEAEIKALEDMSSLVSVSEVENKLRSLTILNITEDMVVSSTNANKYEEEYVVRFSLKGDKQITNVTYNGETGEVTRVYSYKTNYTKEDSTGKQTSDSASIVPEEKINDLAKALAGNKIGECKTEFLHNDITATLTCERVVNDIPYPENSIKVMYDVEEGFVTSYWLYWDKDVSEFPLPEEAIGLDKGTEIIFDMAPLYNTLVKTENGYVPAVTIPVGVTINAITGNEMYGSTDEKVQYTDIDLHWAKDMINALWEHDIYLTGDKFKPEDFVTKADMIRLFTACRSGGIIPVTWTKDRIMEYGISNNYIAEGDGDSFVTRQESFDVLINILGYGDVAGFDIYRSSYTDMEAKGSAEILKAMGVLNGNTARPNDFLTRAEAAAMVYRYLSK